MHPDVSPDLEVARIAALHRYDILDTPAEAEFDDLTRLAANICDAPIAVINLLDRERQWFKSAVGLTIRETPLDISICKYAILQKGIFVVPDTERDARFENNPLVTGSPHLRFYAGALLESSDGLPLGTLCVLDYQPRQLTGAQAEALSILARQVMHLLELRLSRDAVERDITGRKQAEAKIQRLNRLYEVSSSINEAIVRIHDTAELYEQACRIAVEQGGLLMAWVGLGEPDAELKPAAVWGVDDGYLEGITVSSTPDCPTGKGPAGQAFRTMMPVCTNDIAADTGAFASKVEALQRGYRSCAAFPLKVNGKAIGVYVVYGDQPGYFDTEELELLNALAENLSFAVESRQREQQRLRAEAALAAAQRQQKLILEAVGEGIHGLDEEGRIVFGNPAAAAMLGYSDDELIGQYAHTLIHHHYPDGRDYPAEHCPICQTLQDSRVRRVEDEVFFRKDGSSFPVEYVCSPVRSESGAVTGTVVSFRDVTERRRNEEALRSHAALLANAQRMGRMGSWNMDLQTGRLVWSEVTCDLFGITPAEFAGTFEHFYGYILPADQPAYDAAHGRALAGEGLLEAEYRIRRPDGEERWMYERGTLEYDAAGTLVRRLGMVMDITERKRGERIQAWETQVLESISSGLPLGDVLKKIALGVEDIIPGAIASILLLSPEGAQLRQGASPNLSESYSQALDGIAIGPGVGSCGTAAYRRELVAVTDIENDPLWAEYRELAREEGLRACWTAPVLDAAENVLATFAVYYREPRAPHEGDLYLIKRTAHVVRIAIERDRKEQELRASEERFRRTFLDAATGIAITTVDGRFLEANAACCSMLGYTEEELRELSVASVRHPDDHLPVDQLVKDLLENRRESFVLEKRCLAKDGHTVWTRASVSAQRDATGRAVSLIYVAEDITERKYAEAARQESEERFRQLAENIEEVFWLSDPSKNEMLYVSPSYEQIWGRSCQNLYQHPRQWMEAIHPADTARVLEAMERQACGRYNEEYRIVRSDGGIRWIADRAFPIYDASGNVYRIAGVARDITDRRQVEDALRESRRELLTLMSNLPGMVYRCRNDHNWTMEFVSEGAHALTGYTASEFLGHGNVDYTGLIHLDDRLRVWSEVQEAIRARRPFEVAYRILTADGAEKWVWERGQGIVSTEGDEIITLEGFISDVTEVKEKTERIAEQAALLDKAQDAILVRTLDHQVLYWNQSAERLYGWTAAEAVGRSVKELLYRDIEPFLAAMETTLTKGEWTGEIDHITKDGQVVVVEGRWTLVRDDRGEPKSILAINTDITQRKKIEQQFLRAQRMESIGTLAGGIAHDLNNVLTPIMMSVQLLRDQVTDASSRELLTILETTTQRGADLVKQVLLFARGVEGRRLIVQPLHVVHEIERLIHDTFPKNIHVSIGEPSGLWTIHGDPTQLHQVLMNLCVNARDAMPNGGELAIELSNVRLDEGCASLVSESKPGPYLMINVTDTGTGMSAAVLDKIFEPFFTTKEIGHGTGLGLSTTLAIVKSHGGFVNVFSELGNGSTFKLYFPACEGDAESGSISSLRSGMPHGKGELILVVDDEEAVLKAVSAILERFGYQVLVAHNGAEAVSLYTRLSRKIAVVLTDMAMPVMDGPATIVALKAINPAVRIICSSGLTTKQGVSRTVGSDMEHFIPKPYTAEALLRMIDTVVHSS